MTSEHRMKWILAAFGPVIAIVVPATPVSRLAAEITAASVASYPGTRSTWHGFDRFDFTVDGKQVLVVVPRQPAPGRLWV